MTFQVVAHPEHAAGHLERAIQTGIPVLLPGTREPHRASIALDQARSAADAPATIHPHHTHPPVDVSAAVVLDERMGAARVQNPLGRSLLYLTDRLISLLRTTPAT